MMGRSPSRWLLAIVAVLGVIDALQAPIIASRNVAPPSAASHQSATQLQAKKASKPAAEKKPTEQLPHVAAPEPLNVPAPHATASLVVDLLITWVCSHRLWSMRRVESGRALPSPA